MDKPDKEKEDIISRLGEPVWDMREPVNESAKALKALADRRRDETKGYNKASLQTQAQQVLSEPLELTEYDLRKFDKLEREILTAYFKDQTLSNNKLAEMFNVPFQKIVALLRDDRTTDLEITHFKIVGRKKAMRAALRKLDEGDAKVALEIIKELDLLPSSKQDVAAVPQYQTIADPRLEKGLRKFGAWFSGDKAQPLVVEAKDLE